MSRRDSLAVAKNSETPAKPASINRGQSRWKFSGHIKPTQPHLHNCFRRFDDESVTMATLIGATRKAVRDARA